MYAENVLGTDRETGEEAALCFGEDSREPEEEGAEPPTRLEL